MWCPYYKGNYAAEEHVKVNTVILGFTLWRMNVETTTEEAENMQCDKTEIWASEAGGVGTTIFQYRYFPSRIRKILLVIDAAHYPNKKKKQKREKELLRSIPNEKFYVERQ